MPSRINTRPCLVTASNSLKRVRACGTGHATRRTADQTKRCPAMTRAGDHLGCHPWAGRNQRELTCLSRMPLIRQNMLLPKIASQYFHAVESPRGELGIGRRGLPLGPASIFQSHVEDPRKMRHNRQAASKSNFEVAVISIRRQSAQGTVISTILLHQAQNDSGHNGRKAITGPANGLGQLKRQNSHAGKRRKT